MVEIDKKEVDLIQLVNVKSQMRQKTSRGSGKTKMEGRYRVQYSDEININTEQTVTHTTIQRYRYFETQSES